MKDIYTVVIGGANADIGGSPFRPLVLRDSNPGRISVTPGGVGRNIAESMARQGLAVSLLTALGTDVYGDMLRRGCRSLGIDTSRCVSTPDGATSTYLYINDADGDMALAVADMKTETCVTSAYLEPLLPFINGAAAVAVDANLSAETLTFLAERVTAPIFADPVSTAKAPRLGEALPGIHTLKPNRMEAETLTGVPTGSRAGLFEAAERLLAAGVKQVFISCGNEGVLSADGAGASFLPCGRLRADSTTGAGDAFTGGLVKAFLDGLDRTAAAEYAMEYAIKYLGGRDVQ